MNDTTGGYEYAETEVLNRIVSIITGTEDLPQAVPAVLELLGARLGMRYATLALLDASTESVAIDVANGLTGEQINQGIYRLGEGVTGKVAASGQPAIIPITAACPDFLDRTHRGKNADTSFICVPVILGKEILGTISVDGDAKQEKELQDDARFLMVVAAMLAQAIRLRRQAKENNESLREENRRLRVELTQKLRPENIIGTSREMRIVFDQIAQVADSPTTVLIQGETGTGKELVAQALHYNGSRAGKAFVRVNCAALPESLIESELFGHEKGAFTGAVATRRGRFEQADGGTIFLDEIGDITPLTQVKLLRVLQERQFERVGGGETITVDVRVIVATNRDLFAMTRDGSFRGDLFYRINVFPIYLIPLRKRTSDIPALAEHFLAKYSAAAGKTARAISKDALDVLLAHDWPGNVRELENCIEHAVIMMGRDAILDVRHLPPSLTLAPERAAAAPLNYKAMVENYERGLLTEALKATRGNISQAAANLGATNRIISYRIRQLGIDVGRFM